MSSFGKKNQSRSGIISIPAGAGEIVQGQLLSGEDFLVTNPVECFSQIQVNVSLGDGSIVVFPPERIKAKKAAFATLDFFKTNNIDVHVYINSHIPIGKGMASSTADIVGTMEAVARALDRDITPEQISKIAVSIEPSDGLMYRGIVIYNHCQGQLLEYLGTIPPMRQLIIDTGGSIDTIKFNKMSKNYTEDEIKIQIQALNLVKEGIKTSNLEKIGKGATLSTIVNQRLLPKPNLDMILKVADDSGAYGIACAHSGTIVSLLFAFNDVQGIDKASFVLRDMYRTCLKTCSVNSW